MAGKPKKSSYDTPEQDEDQLGGSRPHEQSCDPMQASGADDPSAGQEEEYPISEGSDISASQAEHPDNGGFQETMDTMKETGQRVKRRLSTAVSRGYAAGGDAIEDFEDEMSLRPWSTFLAGALLGGIAGFIIATRR
jgi:gas vesicle protein